MIDEEYVREKIEYELGRQVSNRVWNIIRQHLNQITNIVYFVSLGGNPRCLACAKYPRHSQSVQLCTRCYRGRKMPKDVTDEFPIYMELILPLLYASEE